MAILFNDPMRNGLKPGWTVLNEQPAAGPDNQIVYSNEGVEMLNDQFDVINTDYHFALRLDTPFQNAIWEIQFLPGELAFGYMEMFLHTNLTDDPIAVADMSGGGPWGITQHWDPQASGQSFLYLQHNSSNPIEDTKMPIQDEKINLRLEVTNDGRILASAQADSWGKHYHIFGYSSQELFRDVDLYLVIVNKKSWRSGNTGWNTWRNCKVTG